MADALRDAQELYCESLEAMRDQRRQIEEDLRFSDPSNPDQWEDDLRRSRETDPGGKRPCYVFDQTGQYVANVAGQVEQNPPSLHAIPVGGGADKKAAEQIDGRFRHIEHASQAMQHYARALTSAARVGVGYMLVRPEYIDRALNWQEPRISSEADAMRVIFDPWSVATDGSDADFGYLLTSMPISLFKRKWGEKKALQDFGDLEQTKRDDDRKSILIAEYWKQEPTTKNVVIWRGQDGQEVSGSEDEYHAAGMAAGMQLQYLRNYADKTMKVKWCRMSGADVLEESEYPADNIGIVPVYGYVGFKDGRMRYCGIPRRARNPQQAYNFHMSEMTLADTIIMMPERALGGKGIKELWDRSRVDRRGFLPYIDQDADGEVRAPTLMPIDGVNHELAAQQAIRDIQAAIGMYQANLGAPSNETSGVAIESRKQQGEASTAHFPSHMAASLGHLGNIVMKMDARLSDTRRQQPIIGVDESAGSVTVDPDQKEAFRRNGPDVSINPNVGRYGVRVVVGASYSTQRTQTNAAFTEIIRANKDPAVTATVMPFWAQTLDFPGSDKFAQAMAAMAPDPVKAILKPEGDGDEQDPAMLAQQLDQCKQALQEAIQHAQAAQDDADEAIAKVSGIEADKEVDWYKAETDRLKVTGANEGQIQAIVQQLINDMLSQEAALPGDTPETGMDPALRQPDAWQGGQPMEQEPMPQESMQEPIEPPGPAPEIIAIAEGQQQLAQAVDGVAQGQQTLAEMLQELVALTKRTRKRVPVYDTNGDIKEVIDQMGDE